MRFVLHIFITSAVLGLSPLTSFAADPFLAKKPSTLSNASAPTFVPPSTQMMPPGSTPGTWVPPGSMPSTPYGANMPYPGSGSPVPGYPSGMPSGMPPVPSGPEVIEESIDMEWKGTINGQHIYATRDGNYVLTESVKKKTYKRSPKVSFVPRSATPAVPSFNAGTSAPYPSNSISNGNPNGLPSMVGTGKPNGQ